MAVVSITLTTTLCIIRSNLLLIFYFYNRLTYHNDTSQPVSTLSLATQPPPSVLLSYLGARILLLRHWLLSLAGVCARAHLWSCVSASVQVFLSQAVMAAGGVEDVGLELGTDEVVAGEWHGVSGGGIHSHIAPLSTLHLGDSGYHW